MPQKQNNIYIQNKVVTMIFVYLGFTCLKFDLNFRFFYTVIIGDLS